MQYKLIKLEKQKRISFISIYHEIQQKTA